MKDQTENLSTLGTIHQHRSVRHFTDRALERETILTLLEAAVQAPTAMHEEPWAFSVVQDRALLAQLSDAARASTKIEGHVSPDYAPSEGPENLFHNAGTLIVIWGKPMGPFVAADCWLAAENLMLAACALGLGSCVIGSAVSTLNAAPWRGDLGAQRDWLAIAPIILGTASEQATPLMRKPPEIVTWRTGEA